MAKQPMTKGKKRSLVVSAITAGITAVVAGFTLTGDTRALWLACDVLQLGLEVCQ